MIYLAIVAAVFIVITLQSKIWKSYALKDLEYRVEVSADEVFEDRNEGRLSPRRPLRIRPAQPADDPPQMAR